MAEGEDMPENPCGICRPLSEPIKGRRLNRSR